MKVYIRGIAQYIPNGIIENNTFENKLDTTQQWILERVGISERRFMEDYHGSTPVFESSLRVYHQLIEKYPEVEKDIDYIITANTQDDLHYPNAANILSKHINIDVPMFQLKAACTSVVYAIQIARALLLSGEAKNILILNGEPMTRFVDMGDRTSSILFGDGASALVISLTKGEYDVSDIQTGGRGADIVSSTRLSNTSSLTPQEFLEGETLIGRPTSSSRRSSDQKFSQDGKQVVNFVLNNIPTLVDSFLKRNSLQIDDVDYFISRINCI